MEAGGGGDGDLFEGGVGALGDGVVGADFLNFIAEEVEAAGLGGGDGIHVDDAAAGGVVAGGFADGFAIVVEGAELFEEGLEADGLAAREGDFAGGVFFQSGDGLE